VVTVRAIKEMPKELLPRILAVTMFMSPNCPSAVQDRCKSYCNNDIVCSQSHTYDLPLTASKICTGDGGGRAAGRCNTPAPSLFLSDALDGLDPRMPEEILSLSSPGGEKVVLQQPDKAAVAQCSGPPPAERGRKGYPFYAQAAACYIFKRFNESRS
jgi:hypothetical protein